MLERNFASSLTDEMKAKAKAYIEGCVPDLFDAMMGGESDDYEEAEDQFYKQMPSQNDQWFSIRDFGGDMLMDFYPNISADERKAFVEELANEYAGERQ